MKPFAYACPSTAPDVPLPPEVRDAKLRADRAFFAARGLLVGATTAELTKCSVTKSTETTIPATDSDEKTWDTIDD